MAVLACFTVASCATPQQRMFPPPQAKICNSASAACDVAVDPKCPSEVNLPCYVTIEYDLVLLNTRNGANMVNWRLRAGGDFEFTSDGIVIDPDAFRCMRNGPFMFTCRANKNDFASYKYTIKVMPRSGSRPVDPLDPWVVTN
ncbi:MAG: hypothetical protein ABJB78_06090 [Betaproteobacteria bacterium]